MPKSDTLRSRSVCKDGGYCANGSCIESGDDLVPISWSAFGRAVRVGVDGCLTGLFIFFVSSRLEGVVRGRFHTLQSAMDQSGGSYRRLGEGDLSQLTLGSHRH